MINNMYTHTLIHLMTVSAGGRSASPGRGAAVHGAGDCRRGDDVHHTAQHHRAVVSKVRHRIYNNKVMVGARPSSQSTHSKVRVLEVYRCYC